MGGGAQAFKCFAITTGAESISFDELDVAAGYTVTVNWGDGNSTDLTGEGTNVAHEYAGAGTWYITMSNPTAITRLNCDDAKFGCVAGEIGSLTSLTYLFMKNLANVTVGAGEIGSLTSLTYLNLYALANVTVGEGEIGSLTSLTSMRLYNLANVTIGAGEIGSLTSLTYLFMYDLANCTLQTSYPAKLTSITYQNSLTQANVDDVLFGVYTAALTRTGTNGTVTVSTSNAAPSGVYQAAAACPVDGDTPGKEAAHELTNDGCDAIANHWATVTITA